MAFTGLYGGYTERDTQNRATEGQNLAQLAAAQGLMAKLQENQQLAKYRGALESLGPDAPSEKLMALGRQFIAPKDLASFTQKEAENKAALAQRRESNLARIEQSAQAASATNQFRMSQISQIADKGQRELAAQSETARHHKEMEALNRQANNYGRPLSNTFPQPIQTPFPAPTTAPTPEPQLVPGIAQTAPSPSMGGGAPAQRSMPDSNFLQTPEFAAMSPQQQEMLRNQINSGGLVRARVNPDGTATDERANLASLINAPVDREIARLPPPVNPAGRLSALLPQSTAPTAAPPPTQAPAAGVPASAVIGAAPRLTLADAPSGLSDRKKAEWLLDREKEAGKAGQKITLLGANESAQLNRVLMGGNQVAKALGNIVNLPISSSSGILGGRTQGKSLFEAGKETLTNTMTTQDVQSYNTLTTGIQRAMAAIESSGLAPSNSLMHMMGNVTLKEGDTQFTKLLKLAETRQVVEAGYEVILSNPRVSEQQKTQAKQALSEIRTHVPFTPLQVMQLGTLQQQNPNATMKDVMGGAKGKAPQAAVDYLTKNPHTKDKFKETFGYLPEGM